MVVLFRDSQECKDPKRDSTRMAYFVYAIFRMRFPNVVGYHQFLRVFRKEGFFFFFCFFSRSPLAVKKQVILKVDEACTV